MLSEGYELDSVRRGMLEMARREMEPIRVYRPMDKQLPIHESKAAEVLVRGGKRSGKTLAVAMEFAARILGIPITRPDGQKIPLRYKTPTKDNPRLYWVIGFDVNHIGQTLYHRLFTPGLGCNYRIIYDDKLLCWRAFNEADPEEAKRFNESKLSPPLIPDRVIDHKTWHMESAAGNIFKSVKLLNGATICAYPSTGDHAKQGDAVDGIWIDEDVANAKFLKEWQDRLMTTDGWLLWSVWPHVTNSALIKCMDRAKECEGEDDPPIQCYTLIGSENIYSSKKGILHGLARMDDEDDVAHRDRGDIEGLLGNLRMYDFAPAIHMLQPKKIQKPENPNELLSSVMYRYGRFPVEWTRYLGIDPSHTRTAILFGVVPPPEWEGVQLGSRIIIENELVLKKHTPAMMAKELANLTSGLRFEAFVMDQQVGRQVNVGNDMTVFDSYSKQFQIYGICSSSTKFGFAKGCNEKVKRRRTVRQLLEPDEYGWPRLMITQSRTRWTQEEFFSYTKRQQSTSDGDIIMDEPINERAKDCMQALEYLCQYVQERFDNGTAYQMPEVVSGRGSPAYQAAMALIKKEQESGMSGYVHLGPGAAA